MRAVDLPFVAAIGERDEGKRAGRAGAAHQHHFGRRGHEMQGLRGDRRVGARIALVGDNLHAGWIGGFFERVVDEITHRRRPRPNRCRDGRCRKLASRC